MQIIIIIVIIIQKIPQEKTQFQNQINQFHLQEKIV